MAKSRISVARKLTPRQVLFAKNLAKGTTITDAARNAGYSDKNLAQSGHQALKSIRLRMPELMDDAGLTERTLIEKYLAPLLRAKSTKYFQNRGKVTDKRTVPDNEIRLRALETALELRGCYSSTSKGDPAQTGVKVIIMDMPRPQQGLVMTDIGPSPLVQAAVKRLNEKSKTEKSGISA